MLETGGGDVDGGLAKLDKFRGRLWQETGQGKRERKKGPLL